MPTIAGQEWTYTVGSISSSSAAADFLPWESAMAAACKMKTNFFFITFQNWDGKVHEITKDNSIILSQVQTTQHDRSM